MPEPRHPICSFHLVFLTRSPLSRSAHAVLPPLKQRIGLSYYAMSCLFNSVSTTSSSIDPRQCRPELANTYIFIFLFFFFGGEGERGCKAILTLKLWRRIVHPHLCAGSWLESPGLTAVNSMTQKTSQQLMPHIKSDSPAEQAGSGHGWGPCVPVIK